MERKINYKEAPVQSDHNANSAVHKVIFQITQPGGEVLHDNSYYVKYGVGDRSNNMGDVTYEAEGYKIMEMLGVNTPGYFVGTRDGRIALATAQITGTALHKENDTQTFDDHLDDVLKQNFDMWTQSAVHLTKNPETYAGIRRSCPIAEALNTGQKMLLTLDKPGSTARREVPIGYLSTLNAVMDNLRANLTTIADSNPPSFFQHGDEILSNFIFDPKKKKMAFIDPAARISTRMERALNKILGGSLIFNMDIGKNGQPTDKDRFGSLARVAKRYISLIDDYYQDRSPGQKSSLREILFINLSRIFFGIYNVENADCIDTENKSKYLHSAQYLYDLFS